MSANQQSILKCSQCGEIGYFSALQRSKEYPDHLFTTCQNCHQMTLWYLSEQKESRSTLNG